MRVHFRVSAAGLALGLALASLVGCTSGSSSGGATSNAASTASPAASQSPAPAASPAYTPAAPAGGSVDAQLQAALAAANVTPPAQPAASSPSLVALGQALFFDKVLSGNKDISCAGCHDMAAATGDALPVAMGTGAKGGFPQRQLGSGQLIARNAQPLFNVGLPGMDVLFWDGRVSRDPQTGALLTTDFLLNGTSPGRPLIAAQLTTALAAQAMFPVTVAEEMRGQPGTNELADALTNEDVWSLLMARLVGTQNGTSGGIAGYRALFAAAFPQVASFDDFNFGHAAQAIAAYETEAFTGTHTLFDAYLGGASTALSDGQKRGALLFFGSANCAQCHKGPLLTDLAFHDVGVPQVGPGKSQASEDQGRALITQSAGDTYRFRTPPLRNVAQTGPWMHDGAFETLEGAVRHHLNPAASLAAYDASQLPPLFAATLDTDTGRNDARISAIDPLLGAPLALTDDQVRDLLDFLGALSDTGVVGSLSAQPPASVPSGLPVPN